MTVFLRWARDNQAIIVLCLICTLVLPALIVHPFHSDLDIYQSMGLELYARHGLPYLASWDGNFPGIVLIHALAIALFGNSILGFRMLDLIIQIGIVISMYHVSRLWLAKESSLLGCLFYAIMYVNGPGQFVGQRDCLALLPIVLFVGSCVLAYRSKSGRRWKILMTASGVLIGLTTCIRPTFAILLPLPFLTLFTLRDARGRSALLNELFGFFVVVALCIAPYVFIHGGIREVYLATIRFNIDIYSPAANLFSASKRWVVAAGMLLGWSAMVLWHRQSGRHFQEAPRDKSERRFLIGLIVAIVLEIAAMRRLAGYHMVPLFACFMPALGAIIWETKSRFGRAGSVILTLSIILLFVLLYPFRMIIDHPRQEPVAAMAGLELNSRGNAPEDLTEDHVVDYLRRNTAPNDPVEVAAFTPAVRWRIERPPATRFTTPFPLTMRKADGTVTDYQREWFGEYIQRLKEVRPKYYVIQNFIEGQVSTRGLMLEIPGLSELLADWYRSDTIIGIYYIYVRR
ncbi:MAG: glycosyltransferase family 39 protein [Bacteroidota bacterium]|nr:glycosyltransferase family 39 protein [Bacteroidota bacterium]MDP4234777.1 glycosyltransferase family 39 protein [Bacteroidota bacterium]MDP4244143.1 glycosyltransferase family 39 protein [Bacteroidota bacterium]MDP4289301.1 glycosyltransferase family 39 protein [Bacteroidota bacterium]